MFLFFFLSWGKGLLRYTSLLQIKLFIYFFSSLSKGHVSFTQYKKGFQYGCENLHPQLNFT